MDLSRRQLLQMGVTSLAAIAVDSTGIPGVFKRSDAFGARKTISLTMVDVMVEMVDLTPVYMWAFAEAATGPRIPGPVIFATEGDVLDLVITNQLDEAHGFQIMSKPGTNQPVVDAGSIPPGQTRRLRFAAPPPGTYMYLDPLNAPVNRVLGLHGVLVVMPKSISTPYGVLAGSHPVQQLFNDLGSSEVFPGDKWDPMRSRIWVFNTIDPEYSEAAMNGSVIDAEDFKRNTLPRYFTLSGKTGFFAAHDENISLHGYCGQPMLVRCLNAGMASQSPHIHANHVYRIAHNNVIQDNVWWVDTWTLKPGDRTDVLVPYTIPPDIPAAAWPPQEEAFPLEYPMHCHMEISQTAAGGNYPQGSIAHFMFHGPYPGPGHHDH